MSPAGVNFSPQPQYIAVTVTISAPATVRRGSTLAYTVTITNRSERDYRLDPCPDFNEIVGTQKATFAQYQLNCGPVGTIAAGSTATFAMRTDIAATMATGITKITWTLLDGRIAAASGSVPIDIV